MKNITLRTLRVFEAAAASGSFSRAAKALAMSQPAVSMQIRQFEDELGVRLFDKQARGVIVTDAGRALLMHARDILGRVDVAQAALATFEENFGEQLHVGAICPAHYLTPLLMQAFRARYPNVRIKLSVGERGEILNALSEDRVDLVIAGFPPTHAAIEVESFAHHPHCIVASPDHRLARRRNIAWTDLQNEPFVHREADSATRQFLEYLLKRHKLQANVCMELQGNEAVKQAVMAGMGISFMSAHAFQVELEAGRMVILDVQEMPKMLDWSLSQRRSATLSGVSTLFRDFVLAHGARLASCRTA